MSVLRNLIYPEISSVKRSKMSQCPPRHGREWFPSVAPQNLPSHILQNLSRSIFKWIKDCTIQRPPKPVKIRVLVLARKLRFSRAQSKSHVPIYIVKHLHVKFQDSQHQVAQSKALFGSQSTVGVKWSFGSQKSKNLVNILF